MQGAGGSKAVRHAMIAQSVERLAAKVQVPGLESRSDTKF